MTTMIKTNLAFILITILLLTACAPDAEQSPTEAPSAATLPQPTATVSIPTAPASSPAAESEVDPGATPVETAPIAATETSPATVPEESEAPQESETTVAVSGRTEHGAYFLGRADAPVTIIDYSDFL